LYEKYGYKVIIGYSASYSIKGKIIANTVINAQPKKKITETEQQDSALSAIDCPNVLLIWQHNKLLSNTLLSDWFLRHAPAELSLRLTCSCAS